MSRNISNVAITHFDSMVKQAYQGSSKLRGSVRTKRGVVGKEAKFPVMGRVRAVQKIPRAPVIPANATWEHVTATISDWHVADLTDVFEDSKTNVDERENLATSFMRAIGRQEDQFVIAALAGATAGSTVDIPGTAFDPKLDTITNARPSKLIGACMSALLDKEVPEDGDFTALLPAIWYDDFAADPTIASKDYGPGMVSVKGMKSLVTSHGVELVFMGDRRTSASDIGTLGAGWNSKAGLGYMWEKQAVGMAYGKDPKLDVDWIAERTSWLTCMAFSAGAIAIDAEGIVDITGGPTA